MKQPPAFQFYAAEYIIWSNKYKLAQSGKIFRRVLGLLSRRPISNKDIAYLQSLPFVGRIVRGDSRRASMPPSVRREVLSAGACAICGSYSDLTVDHIKPYSMGGTHDRSNLQCLCMPCNRQKGTKWSTEE